MKKQSTSTQVLLIGSHESQENEGKSLKEMKGFDPFLPNEEDPSKCNAIHSSLWELEFLRQHYAPSVSRLIKIFEHNFEKDHDIEPFLDQSYQSLFSSEVNKKIKTTTPMAIRPKQKLFSTSEFTLWKF